VFVRSKGVWRAEAYAFGPRGALWSARTTVVNDQGETRLQVGRFTRGGRTFVPAALLEGNGQEKADSVRLLITPDGSATVVWSYWIPYGIPGKQELSADSWRLGSSVPLPVKLISPGCINYLIGPGVASFGDTTLVLYGEQFPGGGARSPCDAGLNLAKFQAGRLVGTERTLDVTGFEGLHAPTLSPVLSGVLATWGVDSGNPTGKRPLEFASSPVTPTEPRGPAVPIPLPEGFEFSQGEASQLITGADGDQLVWWEPEPEPLAPRIPVSVAWRSSAGPFRPGIELGDTRRFPEPAATARRDGVTTLLFQQAIGNGRQGRVASVTERRGRFASSQPLSSAAVVGAFALAETTQGRTLAAWTIEAKPGRILTQAAFAGPSGRFGRTKTLSVTHSALTFNNNSLALVPDREGGVLVVTRVNPANGTIDVFSRWHP
jgi:hypothetical protein